MLKKHQTVFYVALGGTGAVVRAKVLVAHKAGGATVEAMFFHEEGRDSGPYLGARHTLPASEVHPSALDADNYRAVARALSRKAA